MLAAGARQPSNLPSLGGRAKEGGAKMFMDDYEEDDYEDDFDI